MASLELFEVEDRAVARSGDRAWAWSGGRWGEAPGLVSKASADGMRLSRSEAEAAFPKVDFDALDGIVKPASSRAAA